MRTICTGLIAGLLSTATAQASPNLLLISIDGLRQDRTTLGGNPAQTSPNLAALARDGFVFTAAHAQSNESMYSHASMLTGLLPSEIARPEYLEFVVPPEATTLAEALQSIGYQTGGFLAGGHVRGSFGFEQGFDTLVEASDFASFFETGPRALSWISKQNTQAPWFAFVHGYDCHRPYAHKGVFWHPFEADYQGIVDVLVQSRHETERIFNKVYYPEANLQRVWHTNGVSMLDPSWYAALAAGDVEDIGPGTPLSEADLRHLKAHYDSGVLVADTYVGLLIDQLKRRGSWENTLVIITSDHGEDLQDHGFTNHRAVLHDSTTHVPLLITGGALPESLRGQRSEALVDALDIVPTLMAMAGTVAPARAHGRDLWSPMKEGRPIEDHAVLQQGVLGQTSLRTATHRLTFRGLSLTDPIYLKTLRTAPLHAKHFALFELSSDPEEQHNIVLSAPAVAAQLRTQMVQRISTLRPSRARGTISPEALQMLRSRGYW
jgi:choline-sulfatase